MNSLIKCKQSLSRRILWGVLFLAVASTGCGRQSNDYAQYEKRAWEQAYREDREELLPTVILSNLNRAIDLAPDRVRTDSYALRAICFDSVGECDKAYHDRILVIQREPNNPKRAVVYESLATELAVRGEYSQAMEYVDRSIELAPDYAIARATRALLYIKLGEWDKWENELRIALELNPDITNIVSVQYIYDVAEKERGRCYKLIK
ncbi:MAG: hypothetical protein GX803_08985 [Lentisphaerae bacterium]|nr:hypothetical protein [Lentisphaerota bacterium]